MYDAKELASMNGTEAPFDPEHMSAQDVANYAKMEMWQVYEMAKTLGGMQSRPGTRWRFKLTDVQACLAQQQLHTGLPSIVKPMNKFIIPAERTDKLHIKPAHCVKCGKEFPPGVSGNYSLQHYVDEAGNQWWLPICRSGRCMPEELDESAISLETYNTLMQAYELLRGQVGMLEGTIAALEGENAALRERAEDYSLLQARALALATEVEEKQKFIEELRAGGEGADGDSELQSLYALLQQQYEVTYTNYNDLLTRYERLRERKDILENQVASLQIELRKARALPDDEALQQVSREREDVLQQLQLTLKDRENWKAAHRLAENKLAEALLQHEQAMAEREAELNIVTSERDGYRGEVMALKEELSQVKEQAQEWARDFDVKSNALRAEHEAATRTHQDLLATITTLQSHEADYISQAHEQENVIQQQQVMLAELTKTLTQMQNKLAIVQQLFGNMSALFSPEPTDAGH